MAEQERMTILEFQKRFANDESCRDHLFKIRWPEGLTCPVCEGKEFYRITKRNVYECKACGRQVYLTAGTIMHGSHTPLHKWFWAIYLAAQDKRGISALALKRELSVAYQTAWTMLHKIRKAMKDRDNTYQLAGIVELDETYMGGPTAGGKRGRGTEKSLVQAALSLDSAGRPEYIKMQVIDDLKQETIARFVQEHIHEGSVISTDGYSSYGAALAKRTYIHRPEKFDLKESPEHLSWLHQIIGNAKTFILGTYHGLGAKHLSAYLSEYCFRTNRRHFSGQVFNRLLNACMLSSPVSYQMLVNPVPTG
jgi:transposase-like protein